MDGRDLLEEVRDNLKGILLKHELLRAGSHHRGAEQREHLSRELLVHGEVALLGVGLHQVKLGEEREEESNATERVDYRRNLLRQADEGVQEQRTVHSHRIRLSGILREVPLLRTETHGRVVQDAPLFLVLNAGGEIHEKRWCQ